MNTPLWPRFLAVLLLSVALGLVTGIASAQHPPNTPVITEPASDGQVVSASDVHMETAPFSDPDPGDTQAASDWEIWDVGLNVRVWSALGVTGLSMIHIHLGDGTFEGPLAGHHELATSTNYRLRTRQEDNTGLWSQYGLRLFQTGPPAEVFPLEVDDVTDPPTPQWVDGTGDPIILPGGSQPGTLVLESPTSQLLLRFRGVDGVVNAIDNPPALSGHVAVRVHATAGAAALAAPLSHLDFTDGQGNDHTIYLPALSLSAGQSACFWIGTDGSSYVGDCSSGTPDFTTLAAAAPVPWSVNQPGYRVDVVASGFQLPVNIAFVPNPGPNADAPFFYVAELYGTIKVVSRDFTVHDYATGLLNFDPSGVFPGSGEQGLSGIVVDPSNGDLYAGMLYASPPPDGPHYPKVVRFTSTDGGRTAATQTTVLAMPGETMGQSHFIGNFTLGPDNKLYVHMGDGFDYTTALNLNSFRGKVLRLNRSGSAPMDNPFYNSNDGITATDYIFAYGLRNPFGGAWRIADGAHYSVEDGPSHFDRFARIDRGQSYGWNGTDSSMTVRAIYNWDPPHGVVNMAWVQSGTFGGSMYPVGKWDHAFVTESGPTYASGPQTLGKRVVEFTVGLDGHLTGGPTTLVEYVGSGKATAVGLAAGPDGLYFTDLYKDQGAQSPIDPGANVLRITYVGIADFVGAPTSGPAPLSVQFTDLSDVPGASAWEWNFGDGGTSTDRNPSHVYASNGLYNVRLKVTGRNGVAANQKNSYIQVGTPAAGLLGEYYDDRNLSVFASSRIDPGINFNWGTGSPDSSMPSDNFSVRWSGRVHADYSQIYTFYTTTDDGVRLWVNGRLLVDEWIDQEATTWTGTIALQAGSWYDLKMEYYEHTGEAVAVLEWSCSSMPRQVIPPSHLTPPGTSDLAERPEPAGSGELVLRASPSEAAGAAGIVTGPTDLELSVPAPGRLRVEMYDAGGRMVLRLLDAAADPGGTRLLRLDPAGKPRGVYWIHATLESGAERKSATRKVILWMTE